jgi:Flp pilus assembly protein TadD
MSLFRSTARRLTVFGFLGVAASSSFATELKITIPERTRPTPVQRLNQKGVEAVTKHKYEAANAFFYKAYLYDPDDPFTLNNLAYIAELDGQVERAQKFYELAAEHMTDAVIDKSSVPKLKGESFRDEVAGIHDENMQVSRANVGAVHLLSQGRGSEAEALLQTALTTDPHNAFTLNNLGVAREAEGDLKGALQYYVQAAEARSTQPIVVTFNRTWRGKPVSDVADKNAQRVRHRIETETPQEQAALLNLQGVSSINRNEWHAADKDFRDAYSLDPNSAFSLNNLGFLSEMTGDLETAQYFYQKARQAQAANDKVGLATRRAAEGVKLFQVSEDNTQKVTAKLADEAAARRQQPGAVELKRRDNQPVIEPTTPPQSAPQTSPAPTSPQSGQSPQP